MPKVCQNSRLPVSFITSEVLILCQRLRRPESLLHELLVRDKIGYVGTFFENTPSGDFTFDKPKMVPQLMVWCPWVSSVSEGGRGWWVRGEKGDRVGMRWDERG